MYESLDKMVSHPTHYQSNKGFEVIDVIEAYTKDLKGIEATDTANIIKYACRWNNKNGIQDLEKIMWYTQHLIDHLKKRDKSYNINYEEIPIKGKYFFDDIELLRSSASVADILAQVNHVTKIKNNKHEGEK